MITLDGYTETMKMSENEALKEYVRKLDELVSWVGREELPYSLRTLHMERLIEMAREAREKRDR
ncbi:MAG: hypothetical protein M3151_07755 [Actinomycetota bacterium]|nr:hypothetical protein [Actinomycetota bacterium]